MSMNAKVALVTGGTSGIGEAAARAFAKAGAKVLIVGRRGAEGEKLAAAICADGGIAAFVQADVSKEEDNKRMVDEAVRRFGRLDFAFNNAGIESPLVPITETTWESYRQVMDINVGGVLMSMKYEIAAMRTAGGGSIVNTSSVAGMIGMGAFGIYVASKHAVLGLTKSAALEVAKENIRVNAVSPGGVETEMYQRFTGGQQQMVEMMKSMHPIGRVGTVDEIASTVLYLCSPGAALAAVAP